MAKSPAFVAAALSSWRSSLALAASMLDIWSGTAVVLLGSSGVFAFLGCIERRRIGPENVWAKPFKFALSLAVNSATFAALTRALSPALRLPRAVDIMTSAASCIELSYIVLQAARGRKSHYNESTWWECCMYRAMGIGALLLMVPPILLGWQIARSLAVGWTPALRFGVSTGLLFGAFAGTVTGMRMGGALSHHVGHVPPPPRRIMRITGWSLDAADLRPAHFLGLHSMQALPLAALAASACLSPPAALVGTSIVSAGWIVLTCSAFWAALSGRPLPAALSVLVQPS